MIDSQSSIKAECKIRGVTYIELNDEVLNIYSTIEKNNMDIVLLEKAPRIAIYTLPINNHGMTQ